MAATADGIIDIIDRIRDKREISPEELDAVLGDISSDEEDYLFSAAVAVSERIYNKKVYFRGLIEFSNYCKNNCYYCGIRCSNNNIMRYRLTEEEILLCCDRGEKMGFCTFVLQGGEDPYFTDERLCKIISSIKRRHRGCAVTVSAGERSYDSYKALYDAGADRYLLRHETADEVHYKRLHPSSMLLSERKKCLFNLKEIGYQVGCGIMVGSPGQTTETIFQDISFMRDLKPQMIGIGPFIAHKDTPFANEKNGTTEMTLRLLSILRLLFPKVLLPATTALGILDENGREKGILAGANVCMPNLSPDIARKNYELYDNKNSAKDKAEDVNRNLRDRIESIGYHVVDDRGDHPDFAAQ